MKKFYSRSIALLLAIVINMFIPFAGSVNAVADEIDISKYGIDPNILLGSRLSFGFDGSGTGIVDQYWYTKLIKLDGYNQKDVSGTLHYEIVPDYSITSPKKYYVDIPTIYSKVRVNITINKGRVPRYKYDVPFSSNDFVDTKFNDLCDKVSTDFGLDYGKSWSNQPKEYGNDEAKVYVDLFNHAFLHEWGTVITNDPPLSYDNNKNQKIYRVGKISQSHFSTIQNYLNYVKQMRDKNLWIDWDKDPETYVAGYVSDWNKSNSLDGEANIYRCLWSRTADEKSLVDELENKEHPSAYKSFRDGTMEFTKLHTIPEYFKNGPYDDGRMDRLYTITRPIAISKKYDSNGNITLLEKPLFPSASMPKFIDDNTYYYHRDFIDDHTNRLDIYRYILREKQPTGVNLKCNYEPYILDVVYSNRYEGGGKIFIYENGKESDYKEYYKDNGFKTGREFGPFVNEVSNRVQVVNTYGEPNPEPEPTPTPEPTNSDEPGDGAKDLLSWNINFGPGGGGLGIIDQVWYTKWIDLRGYQGKDISGTLHFELVPDETAHEEYTIHSRYFNKNFPDDPNGLITVKVLPGVMTYKYNTPFSSDDFVDEEFNKLVTEARSDFVYSWSKDKKKTANDIRAEHMFKLFDHAFLHEWGTIRSTDEKMYRVGKVLPSHFATQEEYNEYCNSMENSHLWINWKNDPEKHVTGYRTSLNGPASLDVEAKADRPLIRDDETISMHLATIPSFLSGKMSFTSEFIKPRENIGYILYVLTRNIAISKTYDSAGNITSIEKPLFPSVPLLDFYAKHNAKVIPEDYWENGPFKDIDECDYVFRYKLIERDATGVDITPTDEEVYVEVAYQSQYGSQFPSIRMYQNEKKAKENRYTYRVKPGVMDPFVSETTDKVRVLNRVNVKDYPQTGDNNHIWLYLALIGVATTTIFIIRKRKTN